MKEVLKNHLVATYNPLGIILHGSRANGYATEHSDWDFFLFTDQEIPNKRKHVDEIIEGQFLDIMIWQFPVSETDIKNYFAKYCGSAELLYGVSPLVDDMFAQAQKINRGGKHFSNEEYLIEKVAMTKELDRLADWINDTTGVFYLRVSELYKKFYDLWWVIKNNKYSISPRKGLLVIKQQDEYFFNLLQILSGNSSNENSYRAVVDLKTYLFK